MIALTIRAFSIVRGIIPVFVFAMCIIWVNVSYGSLLQNGAADLSTTLTIADTSVKAVPQALDSKVKYSARDSIRFDVQDQKVYLFGAAKIEYEDIVLEAGFIKLDWEAKILYATGVKDSAGNDTELPVFTQGGSTFKPHTITYNFDTKRGRITEVSTKEGEGFVTGEVVKKEANDNYYIRNGRYSTCDLEHQHYYVAANKLKVIKNKKIVSGPAYLVIADVPTPLAVPFGMFPSKSGRSSGILFPAYGESSNLGFFLRDGGYYFGLSDHFDLALRGDIYTLGSYGLKANSNYATRYRYNGNVQLSYSNIRVSEPELPDFSRTEDFFIRWSHAQNPKARPNTQFSASVNAGSSTFYRNNLNTGSNFLNNTFQSTVSWAKGWAGKPYNLSLSLRHSQNTITRDVDLSLPEAAFTVNRLYPFRRQVVAGKPLWYEKIGVSYAMNLQNTIQTKDTLLFDESSLQLFRNGIRHSIPVTTSLQLFKHFTLSPTFNYSERWYLKTTEKRWDAENMNIVTDTVNGFVAARDFSTSAALSTRVYGMIQFRNAKVLAVRHVFTPSISFTYRPDFADDNWGYYKKVQSDTLGNTTTYSRFETGVYGGPASGKVQSIGWNFDNNLEMKVRAARDTITGTKKIKIFESIGFSGGYNFAADSLKLSNIGINGRTVLLDRLNINFGTSFDPYVLDSIGRKIDKFEYTENKRLSRLTSANISAGVSLNSKRKETLNTTKGTEAEREQILKNQNAYVDFTVPWNLSVNYNFVYSKPGITESNINQSMSFNGDLRLTPKWKIGFSSGYDLKEKDFTYSSFDLYRDLHCWEMKFNWIPFGYHQSYYFQINVKSSVLQDLKLSRKRDWYDRSDQ